MKIQQCDIFIYGGGESDKWVDNILKTVDDNVTVIRMMDIVELCEEEHHSHENEEHIEDEIEYDEHVWTSPLNAIEIVKAISDALITCDSENTEYYQENTENYIEQLHLLDMKFEELFIKNNKPIIVGDRFPFQYFAVRYNLEYYSAFPGCSAQAEANPKTISELIEKCKTENISVVFKVDLSKGNVAKTIADTTGASVETLYSCHVITADDYADGITYIGLMHHNYDVLSEALS